MLSSNNRPKRNLPSVPNHESTIDQLQLRRTNSESRFSLPAVPNYNTSPANLDDESDLLEIDLNDPIGSMNRTCRTQHTDTLKRENSNPTKVKQHRDQTTNTPPLSTLEPSIKAKKKSLISNELPSPSIVKLEKVRLLSKRIYFFDQ